METKKYNWFAIFGLLTSIPALIIVGIGMLSVIGLGALAETFSHYITPQSLILHPVLVLGGLLVSIGLNIFPIFKIRFEPQVGALVTMITTRFRIANMFASTVSLFLLCAILLYAFGENFRIVVR